MRLPARQFFSRFLIPPPEGGFFLPENQTPEPHYTNTGPGTHSTEREGAGWRAAVNNDNRYLWKHKDLLDVSQLSREDTVHLLDLAASFQEINRRPVKKVPTLKGKTVVLFFSENSTRTKTSFDMAGKRLSADTFALSKSGSSINKGETLKDTAQTLMARRHRHPPFRKRRGGISFEAPALQHRQRG